MLPSLLIFVATVIVSSWAFVTTLRLLQWALARFLLVLVLVMLTGVIRVFAPSWFSEVHRWGAHALVVVAWIVGFMLAGSAAAWRSGESIVSRAGTIVMAALVPGTLLFASFTGYLYPHDLLSADVDEITYSQGLETANRFYVLHGMVVPVVTLFACLASLALLSQRICKVTQTSLVVFEKQETEPQMNAEHADKAPEGSHLR